MSTGEPELLLIGSTPADRVTPELVGAKAYILMRMADAGLPVPPGFVLPTSVCSAYHGEGAGAFEESTRALVRRGVRALEATTARRFGSSRHPLLVSVRSGAPVSMPGMLDTVLDVGLTDASLAGLIRETGDPVFAWDCYRRLIESYAEVVSRCPPAALQAARREALERAGVPELDELDVAGLRTLVETLKQLHQQLAGHPFPQDPMTQLAGAVEAVLRSWGGPRAVTYRELEGLSGLSGTAVAVQAMVFGNRGATSGSGVGFTRDPATGENTPYVDFLLDAQGEDVVGGRRAVGDTGHLLAVVPGLAPALERVRGVVETLFGDVQDFEFTVEDGQLWMLQSRPAKRTPWAAVRVACDLVDEGLIDVDTALARLSGLNLNRVGRVRLVPPAGDGVAATPLTRGLPGGTGVAVGRIALDVEAAGGLAGTGDPVILTRSEATTGDVAGLAVCAGLLTATGSRTSHAAVVARHLGVVSVLGCSGLVVDVTTRGVRVGTADLAEGDWVTIDGDDGQVYAGRLDVTVEQPEPCLSRVRAWRSGHQA